MKYDFICLECVESDSKPVGDMSMAEYKIACTKWVFTTDDDKCPLCNSERIQKVYGLDTSYVRGYGYHDKAGVKRDMDLHLMAQGEDPYKESRDPGEARDVIQKLQKSREFKKNSISIPITRD